MNTQVWRIIIPGKPIILKRPRFSTRTGKAYNSQKKEMNTAAFIAASQWSKDPIDKPVSIKITFYIKGKPINTPYIGKWDIDNAEKFVLDILQPYILSDDRFVVELYAIKLYSTESRTEIEINHFDERK